MSTTTKKKSKKDQSTAPTSAENACKAIDLVTKTTDAKPPLSNTEILKATAKAIAEENQKKLSEYKKAYEEVCLKLYQFKVDAVIAKIRSSTDEDLATMIRKDDCISGHEQSLEWKAQSVIEDDQLHSDPRFWFRFNEKQKAAIKSIAPEFTKLKDLIASIKNFEGPSPIGKTIKYNLCAVEDVFALLRRQQQLAKAESVDRTDKILADPELRDALVKAGHKLLSFTPANRNAIEA